MNQQTANHRTVNVKLCVSQGKRAQLLHLFIVERTYYYSPVLQ